MVPAAEKVDVFESSAACRQVEFAEVTLQLFTAVLGCEGFPAPLLSRSFKPVEKTVPSSAGSGALTSVRIFMLPPSRTLVEEK